VIRSHRQFQRQKTVSGDINVTHLIPGIQVAAAAAFGGSKMGQQDRAAFGHV
jgi:hypothetical protein